MSANRPAPDTTIVVAEDDTNIRELITYLLESEGYHVVPVARGGEVVSAVTRSHANLLVLDLALPDEHGNQVLLDLQRDSATRSVPVVVVSAYVDQLLRTPQVKGVISKPFDVSTLIDDVAHVLKSAA